MLQIRDIPQISHEVEKTFRLRPALTKLPRELPQKFAHLSQMVLIFRITWVLLKLTKKTEIELKFSIFLLS